MMTLLLMERKVFFESVMMEGGGGGAGKRVTVLDIQRQAARKENKYLILSNLLCLG